MRRYDYHISNYQRGWLNLNDSLEKTQEERYWRLFLQDQSLQFKTRFPRTSPIYIVLGINAFGLNDGRKPPNNTISFSSRVVISYETQWGEKHCQRRKDTSMKKRMGAGWYWEEGGSLGKKMVMKWHHLKDEAYPGPARWRLRTCTNATKNVFWKWIKVCKENGGDLQTELRPEGIP